MIVLLLSAALAAPISPEEAVAAALVHSPALVAAEGAVLAARGQQQDANFLRHNPTLDLSVSTDGSLMEASLAQPLSLTGEGLAAARSARSALAAAEAEAERARLLAAAEARRAWIRAAEAFAQRSVAEGALAAISRHRQAVEARVNEGSAPGLDLRLARLDEASAAGDLLAARRDDRAAREALAALTGIADAEAVGDPLTGAPATWSPGERADLAAANARIEAAEARRSAERAAVLPALGLGAFVERDDGISRFGPSLTVELPLWAWNSGGRAEAQRDLDLARAEATSLEARIQVEQAATGDEDLLAHLGATPSEDAEAVLSAVDAAWQAGAVDAIEASLLRARALEGQRAAITARAALADARITAALAAGSRELFPVAP